MRWRVMAVILSLALLGIPTVAPAAGAPKIITITAKEFTFTPFKITAKVEQRVQIRVSNKGTMDHEFLSTIFKAAEDVVVKVEGVNVEAEELEEVEVEPGHSVTIELTPTKAGTYAFWCAEKSNGKLHRDLGMKGTITVTR